MGVGSVASAAPVSMVVSSIVRVVGRLWMIIVVVLFGRLVIRSRRVWAVGDWAIWMGESVYVPIPYWFVQGNVEPVLEVPVWVMALGRDGFTGDSAFAGGSFQCVDG